jgi:hypothetical protein
MADQIAFDMEFDLYLDPEAADMPDCGNGLVDLVD